MVLISCRLRLPLKISQVSRDYEALNRGALGGAGWWFLKSVEGGWHMLDVCQLQENTTAVARVPRIRNPPPPRCTSIEGMISPRVVGVVVVVVVVVVAVVVAVVVVVVVVLVARLY